jgi:hypothetical protein
MDKYDVQPLRDNFKRSELLLNSTSKVHFIPLAVLYGFLLMIFKIRYKNIVDLINAQYAANECDF